MAQPQKGGAHRVKADEEIVVYSDLFARWKDTRWFVETEVRLPTWMFWAADENLEVRVPAFQVRTVLACEKYARIGRRRIEVFCHLEDVGLQAVTMEARPHVSQPILDEMREKLSGAALKLQVRDNGRVTNIGLRDTPEQRNRRERQINEAMRMILSRLVVGFDMKLRRANFLRTGQWVENRTALLSMPSTTLSPASGLIVHQLNGFEGHVVVQTKGEGQIMDDQGVTYKVDLNGVSIYDQDEGYMTERVWSLVGIRTADSYMTYGTMMGDYGHFGRLRMLGDDEQVDVGPTQEVRMQGRVRRRDKKHVEQLPLWVPLDHNQQAPTSHRRGGPLAMPPKPSKPSKSAETDAPLSERGTGASASSDESR